MNTFVKSFFSPINSGPVVEDSRVHCAAKVILYDADGKKIPLVETDIGYVEISNPTTLAGEPCSPADHISQRLEMHPHASDHPDAPLVRFMPGHEPDVHHYCPTGMDAIKAHLAERGEHGLHPEVMAALKAQLLHRDDIDAKTCRHMGLSYTEIRALPKFERLKHEQRLRNIKVDAEADRLTIIGKTAQRIARHRAKKAKKNA